jgi:hypothetical protein
MNLKKNLTVVIIPFYAKHAINTFLVVTSLGVAILICFVGKYIPMKKVILLNGHVQSALWKMNLKKSNGDNPPNCLMDIVDEAYDLLSDRIDVVRQKFYLSGAESVQNLEEVDFLKDLRDLLKLSENFRDE